MADISYLTVNSVRSGVGASQVWEYVRRLPEYGHEVNLTSFEDGGGQALVVPEGVSWWPSKFNELGALDAAGRLARLLRVAAHSRDHVLHARGDIPALAAVLARHTAWVWDMRAFWREQRIASGSMRIGGLADQAFKHVEHLAAEQSSAIICLADAAKRILQQRHGTSIEDKTIVIPTAVDTHRFVPAGGFRAQPRMLISGSMNGLYDGDLTIRFVDAVAARRSISTAWVGATTHSPWFTKLKSIVDVHVESVSFEEMPDMVRETDAGLALCRLDAGAALAGAMPTKVAEFLASGVPVVVSRGTGDLENLVDRYRCGAVVRDTSEAAIGAAADELVRVWSEPEAKERCRACAVEIFDIGSAVEKMSAIYDKISR